MKKSKIILEFLLIIVLLLILGTNVQAERVGNYTLEDGCITRILPEITVAEFKNNLSIKKEVVVKDKAGLVVQDSSIVKTGMTLEIEGTSYKTSVVGDINGDGKITITDVVQSQLNISNIRKLEGERAKSADINNDGKKSITDLVQLKLVQVKIKNITDFVKNSETGDTNSIYATLYDDGTLAFTATNKKLVGKTVVKEYGDIYENEFYYSAPWLEDKEQIKSADIVDSIKPKYLERWFWRLDKLEKIDNISNLDTSKVTDMNFIFAGCSALTSLDLNSFDTSNVTNMNYMFSDCTKLTSLNISSFNTNNVKEMQGMFEHCESLTSLDLSSFNTINVTRIGAMFAYCTNLTSLDLSNFDISNVINMDYMFLNSGLTNIYVNSNWNTDKASAVSMLSGCGTDHVTVVTRTSLSESVGKLRMFQENLFNV